MPHPSQVWKKKRDEEARHRQGGRERLATQYAVDSNAALVTIDTDWTEVCSVDFPLATRVTILVHFTANLQNSEAASIEAQVKINNVEQDFEPQDYMSSAQTWLFTFVLPYERVAAGDKNVTVFLKTGAGTVTVDPDKAWLTVEARGMDAEGVPFNPVIELTETITAWDIGANQPDETVSVKAGGKVSASETESITAINIGANEPSLGDMYIFDQQYTENDDSDVSVAGDNWEGQAFETQFAHDVNVARVYVKRSGTPGTVTLAIYATDASNLPTGSALVSATFDGDTISESAEWVEVSLTATSLTADTVYALVLDARDATGANALIWRSDTDAGYPRTGSRVFSSSGGTSWTADNTRDYLFIEGTLL